jgi:hypothetical protein
LGLNKRKSNIFFVLPIPTKNITKIPMKSKSTISIPATAKYLSDVLKELPKNCLFNKGAVGAGGTTIALSDNANTVICVPYKSLIDNKVIQSKENKELYPYELLGVHGDTTDVEIHGYLNTHSVKKIMVTYDSLPRLMKFLEPQDFTILVDEYHCLFTEYSFRKKACMAVLNNYKAFESFTFMSATPIEDDFILEELKNIDVVTAEWEDVLKVSVQPVKCQHSLDRTIISVIERALSGEKEGNYYFFVNSVTFIKKMIANCKLNNKNCRVIYSEGNDSKLSVKRGKTTDAPKKINFITKTAFEGSDIYDEDGKIFILSDGDNPHTLVDISTQFLQISGRIRNSKYKNAIHHVYTSTRYSDGLTFSEFNLMRKADVADELAFLNEVNKMSTFEYRKRAVTGKQELLFHNVDDDTQSIVSDENRHKIDLYQYKILNSDYVSQVNLGKEYEKNNLIVSEWWLDKANPEVLPVDDVTNFEATVKELSNLAGGKSSGVISTAYMALKAAALLKYDFLDEALSKLGFDGIAKQKYIVTNVKKKLVQLSPRNHETSDLARVAKLLSLSGKFKSGSVVTGSTIKDELNKIYKKLNIDKKATSKDLDLYYHTKETKRLIDGKQQRSYAILSAKIQVS